MKYPLRVMTALLLGVLVSALGAQARGSSSKESAVVNTMAPELRRLDPHGSVNLQLKTADFSQQTECRVCHIQSAGKWLVKAQPAAICLSCHGTSPHSGAPEHLRTPKITCLSCHFAHRADAPGAQPSVEPEFSIQHRRSSELPAGLEERTHSSPRLRKRCEECHRWP